MTNELIPFDASALPAIPDDAFETLKNKDFLQRLQMFGCSSDPVKEGKITGGHWAIVDGEGLIDLGPSVDIIPLIFRPKAIDFTGQKPVAHFDPESDEYKAITTKKGKGWMHGPSFLVLERSTGSFYEVYFGSVSGRQEAPKLRPFVQQRIPCTLTSRLIKRDNTYHVPVVRKCSEPFEKVPPIETVLEEIAKFMAEKKGPEEIKEGDVKTAARAR